MKRIFFLLLVSITGLTARGQFEKIIQPSDLKQKTIITEPTTLNKGFFRVEAGVMYMVQDKYFNSDGNKEYYPASMWGARSQFNLGLRYGISDRFEVDVLVPVVNEKIDNYFVIKTPVVNTDNSLSSKLRGRGIGDCNLMVKYQLVPEKERGFSLTLLGDVTFPTGQKNPTDIKDFNDYKLPTGYGYFSSGIWIYARKIMYPYSVTTLLNYQYNFHGSKLMDAEAVTPVRFKKGNRFTASGSFNFHLNEWIALANELWYFHSGKGEESNGSTIKTDPTWTLDYAPRLIFQVRRFRINEIVNIPLTGKDNSADPAYTMSVLYTF
jgi:hypothetical protein